MKKYPLVKGYFKLEQIILATSALLQDKTPNNKGMLEMKKDIMIENWESLEKCLDKLCTFLTNEGVFNKQLLPTNAVLAVIASLYNVIPETLDDRGRFEILLKKYLWSSFFTDRYENAAAGRAFKDYSMLKNIILGEKKDNGNDYDEYDVPVLNREIHAISDIDFLAKTGWPKGENIRARAIMCVASKLGAYDFSDGQKLSLDNLKNRDYHHIFPKAILREVDVNPDLALNCSIITSSTNKSLGAKAPMEYIKEKFSVFDESTIKQRLYSHLIPVSRLTEIKSLEDNEPHLLKRQYEAFIRERASLIKDAAEQLCKGRQITPESILSKSSNLSIELRELDEEISKIEIATRGLIVENTECHINQKLYDSAETKYLSWIKKNPGEEKESPLLLELF